MIQTDCPPPLTSSGNVALQRSTLSSLGQEYMNCARVQCVRASDALSRVSYVVFVGYVSLAS